MSATINKIIRRGDIWRADLRIGAVGSDQGEIRPVLVVQNNIGNKHSPTVTVVPLTSRTKNNLPTHVILNEPCLPSRSIALVDQIKTIDKSRLIRYIGRISESIMNQINEAIAIQVKNLKLCMKSKSGYHIELIKMAVLLFHTNF